ncbi:sporulation-delaying protein SdpB family protein [Rhodococcoides fascians]|uniref:sporulation-delaying protein SdpB family protein n=1 Tax=Rhodococcoides fascians TaxID=1828 RepID=UPI00068C3F95|nr:sporulation-delaying protein SdpB family protein [Rhodococcus fascians]
MLTATDALKALGARARSFDSRTRGFGIGRSLIAFAQLTVLLGTTTPALFASLLDQPPAPHCGGMNSVSLFCVAGDTHLVAKQYIAAAVLALVMSGWSPRFTGIPHAWISFSILSSISLPDGGDSIAQIVTALLVPLALFDGRRWHWTTTQAPSSESARAIAYACMLLLRLQLGYIYIYSAISKFGVTEWANGSAEYYYVRDRLFGAEGIGADLWHALTMNSVATVAMTWGSLLVEIVIGVLLVVHRYRGLALGLDLFLHIGIIVTLGLWSFALVMIGAVVVATYGQRRLPQPSSSSNGVSFSANSIAGVR